MADMLVRSDVHDDPPGASPDSSRSRGAHRAADPSRPGRPALPKLPPAVWAAVIAGATLALVLVVLVGAYVFDGARSSGRIIGGVRIAGTDVGGLTRDAAAATLMPQVQALAAEPQPVKVADSDTTLAPADLGFSVDVDAALNTALAAGRGNPLAGFVDYYAVGFFGPRNIKWKASLDRAKTQSALDEISFDGAATPAEPDITYEGSVGTVTPPSVGKGVPLDAAVRLLTPALLRMPRTSVTLPVEKLTPRFGERDAKNALKQAIPWVKDPVKIVFANQAVTVDQEKLAQLLDADTTGDGYTLTVRDDAVNDIIRPLLPNRGTEPVDAKFVPGPDGHLAIVDGTPSNGCCAPGSGALVLAAMQKTDPADRVATLATGTVPPKQTADDLKKLLPAFKDKLGEFTTRHPPGETRVQNIHKIADLTQGVIVDKGKRFSLNGFIGPRTKKGGWREAPSIADGAMTTSAGGGISQFATTLYNAVYFAGMTINEHKPHSVWFPRYPRGREATMGYPKPDLVFTNDTPGPVVIVTSYTPTSVHVEIWGASDGRTTTASDPKNYPAPVPGCTNVDVTRTIKWPDGRVKDDKFTTSYHAPGGSCD